MSGALSRDFHSLTAAVEVSIRTWGLKGKNKKTISSPKVSRGGDTRGCEICLQLAPAMSLEP